MLIFSMSQLRRYSKSPKLIYDDLFRQFSFITVVLVLILFFISLVNVFTYIPTSNAQSLEPSSSSCPLPLLRAW